MTIPCNHHCLQEPQSQTHHHLPVASLPGIGNISGNDSGNISGNKIGKNGNAVRLLPITRAAATVTDSPEKISSRAEHLTSTTAPAMIPAMIPATIPATSSAMPTTAATLVVQPFPPREGSWRSDHHRPPRTSQKRENPQFSTEIPSGNASGNASGNGGKNFGNISGNIHIATCRMPVVIHRRRRICTFPLSNPLPGMFLTCAGAIVRSSE